MSRSPHSSQDTPRGPRRPSTPSTSLWIIAATGWIIAMMLAIGVMPPLHIIHRGEGDDITSMTTELDSSDSARLISQHYPFARADDEGWDYHRILVEDLNDDGQEETVHVIANISRHDRLPSEFLWDDGHVWQVYVEDADGHITYLFSDWVQLGQLKVVALDHFADPENRGIGIIREQGAGLTLYRIHYEGPGVFDVVEVGSIPILREAVSSSAL